MNEQREKGIIEEALDIHCAALGIPEKLIKEYYFDLWANWKPGNSTDQFVYTGDEVTQYCYNRLKPREKYKGRGVVPVLGRKV